MPDSVLLLKISNYPFLIFIQKTLTYIILTTKMKKITTKYQTQKKYSTIYK